MAISQPEWTAVQGAAATYNKHAAEIARIEHDIATLRQGHKKLVDISPNPQRVQARLQREKQRLAGTTLLPALALERSMGRPDFQDACILQRIVGYGRCVGRIMLAQGGYGTGWLIGEGLLITNHHVLPNASAATGAYITMGYERTEEGKPQAGENFELLPDQFFLTPRETQPDEAYSELDFTVVAVAATSETGKALAAYKHVRLDAGLGKIIEGENCMIFQHPGGDYKKVVLRDIRLLKVLDVPGADQHVFYESDTLPGSSGAMVVALGTGEIFALHNASVPRTDAQGNYLKKDGSVYKRGEDEDLIDWIANQGVRISKILGALQTLPLPAAMEPQRQRMLQGLARPAAAPAADHPEETAASLEPAPILPSPAFAPVAATATRFLLKLTAGEVAQDYTRQLLKRRFPAGSLAPLLAEGDASPLGAYAIFDVPAEADPWMMAAQLEAVDGVEEAEPDLPQRTTEGAQEFKSSYPQLTEGMLTNFWEDGRAEWDEHRFLRQWRDSVYLEKLDPKVTEDLANIRRWNHRATGFDQLTSQHLNSAAMAALADLRIAQFDTGYTDHAKLKDGYDLAADYDLLANDDDARDEGQGGFLKAPGHGTRTGSVLVGCYPAHALNGHDGNLGLLRALPAGGPPEAVKLTPFRVAKSVLLINRVSELVRGVHRAVEGGFPVLTMSMGMLGNRLLAEVARYCYDRGVIWCCAAGNQVKFVVAPGKYPGVICVAASNPDDAPWSGSCRGPEVDITAPGQDVYVPILNEEDEQDMAYGSGTSYATPHVAAAALLWLARHHADLSYAEPWQRVEAFRYCLAKSARRAPELRPDKYGPGILQVDKLLEVPLPTGSELHYAYPAAGARLERAPSERLPLAQRELAYKDWQRLLASPTQPNDDLRVGSRERQNDTVALSELAQEFAQTLATHNDLRPAVAATEGTGHSLPTGSYLRLRLLQRLQARTKPVY